MDLIAANDNNIKQQESSTSPLLEGLKGSETEWHDLRVVEMSGFDYIFAPKDVCRAFTDLKTLQSFIETVQDFLYSEPERVVLVSYHKDISGEQHFERFDINWVGKHPLDCTQHPLTGTAQLDFIKMLFDHSEQLHIA